MQQNAGNGKSVTFSKIKATAGGRNESSSHQNAIVSIRAGGGSGMNRGNLKPTSSGITIKALNSGSSNVNLDASRKNKIMSDNKMGQVSVKPNEHILTISGGQSQN